MADYNVDSTADDRSDFEPTPEGQYKYWSGEYEASNKMLKQWKKQGDRIVNRYLDNRRATGPNDRSEAGGVGGATAFRLNIFSSNVHTITAMMYSHLPKIETSRRNLSQNDDVGRVAAEMMERLLTLDLQDNGSEYDSTFKAVLQDRLLPGLGVARVRYEMEESPVKLATVDGQAAQASGETELLSESAPIDYYHWGDVLWGWARTFAEIPWIGYRSYLTKSEVEARFGEKAAEGVSYKKQKAMADDEAAADTDEDSDTDKAEIWEIWDKSRREVVWWSDGYDKVLETTEDPLGLTGFYPCPPFFIANVTTALYIPTPDYHMAQDLYNEVDRLQTRIAIITEAVRVVGLYDAAATGVKRMLQEGVENDLIPVDQWAMFAETGGIAGAVDWLPLADIVGALDKLRTLRDETIALLQQITGMADVMRGGLDNQYEGVGQTKIKAKFGSVRVQALQEDFADFCTDLMQLKAEVIARHFSPDTIVKQSNMQFSTDQELLGPAVELIKNPEEARIRIKIRSETMAMIDYAEVQQERAAYLTGLTEFLKAAMPMIQMDKRVTPFLLEMLKWAMAGFKGSSEIEGVLDKAIETMQQPEQNKEDDKPDPEQQKIQGQIELEQMRIQGKQASDQQNHQNDMELREQDKQADIETRQAENMFNQQKTMYETEAELNILAAKMEADVQTELMTSQINAEQQIAGIEAQTEADIRKARLEIEKLKITKRADAGIKLMEKRMDADDKDKDRLTKSKEKDDG